MMQVLGPVIIYFGIWALVLWGSSYFNSNVV